MVVLSLLCCVLVWLMVRKVEDALTRREDSVAFFVWVGVREARVFLRWLVERDAVSL